MGRADPWGLGWRWRDRGAPGHRLQQLMGAGDAVATLVRVTGSIDLAEDVVQDAAVRALETWPRDGVPDNPRAWLLLTAKRRAIDVIRREARRAGKEAEAMSFDPD